MDGKTVVKIVERVLAEKGITKGEFYEKCGISSATFSQWRSGQYEPSSVKINMIEEFLGITLSDDLPYATKSISDEKAELLERLINRPDLEILLRSASDVPPSSVYEIVSKLEKMKEDAT